MKTLKEIKEANKSIVLYDEEGYLVLTEKNVQTDEIVAEYINRAKDTDIIEMLNTYEKGDYTWRHIQVLPRFMIHLWIMCRMKNGRIIWKTD